ncbi:MAG: aspartate/glutamate racemase family protein [Spirochaetes bacterium]|nr:MAG: aspartate/glutamate racemase family protein [Spirochaetota bacterium]
MIYRVKEGQVSYGEAIGIILLENYAPFIPGDVANATTYSYPVRFQRVEGFTVERIFKHDLTLLDSIIDAAKALVREGVRAVTGDCGFMAIYQDKLADTLDVPVFMSSLLQIPFILSIIGQKRRIGIVTASAPSLNEFVFNKIGIHDLSRLVIGGLEDKPNFASAALREEGFLDSEKVEGEVVSVAKELAEREPDMGAILLECSLLPPYGAAVREALELPVFDFVTMIDYVFSAVVKKRFKGFM